MALCEDDLDILTLNFEHGCECKGCPTKIHRAIMSCDGVIQMRSMDYKKGTAELIVKAEIAENPKILCDWIRKKANKYASIAPASEYCFALHSHGGNESFDEERIRYKEIKEVEIYKRWR